CTAKTDGTAASSLASLSCVIGMDESELTYLVLDDNKTTVNGVEVSGDSTTDIFKNYPLKLPKKASVARASLSKTIANLHTAIAYICPFVNDAAKVDGDSRHSAANCPP